jgi:hypothetical protein
MYDRSSRHTQNGEKKNIHLYTENVYIYNNNNNTRIEEEEEEEVEGGEAAGEAQKYASDFDIGRAARRHGRVMDQLEYIYTALSLSLSL